MREPRSSPQSLWDVEDVATRLAVRPRWVYEHLSELPHYRVGRYVRFEAAEVEEWIRQQQRAPEVQR